MNIGLVGNTKLTKKALISFLEMGEKVRYVFGLPPEKLKSKVNAVDLVEICKANNIEYDCSGNWLNLCDQRLDLIVVLGDSRIVPPMVLENNHVIGNHGAALPQVQGAATLVWARMLNLGYWGVSIFELEGQIDSGRVLCTDTFDYHENCTMEEFVNMSDNLTIACLEKVVLGDYDPTGNKKFDLRVSKHADSEKSTEILRKSLELGLNVYMPPRTPEDSVVNLSWDPDFIKVFKLANSDPYPTWSIKPENDRRVK